MAVISPEILTQPVAQQEMSHSDRYVHFTVTEANNLYAAHEAWRIQAEGYLDMGFVTEEALTPEGYLVPELDKSRGKDVEYHLAVNPCNMDDCATVRKVSPPKDGTYRDLPSYKMAEPAIYPDGRQALDGITEQDRRLKEISALARTKDGSAVGVYEIFRKLIQDATGSDEVWFFSTVSTTFQSLVRSFGERNFAIIGDDISMPDARVNSSITLRPTIVTPGTFIERVLDAHISTEGKGKGTLKRSFLFLADGLEESRMSPRVVMARNAMLQGK